MSSVLGEDADGVVPIEVVADPAGGGRVGGDVSMFVSTGVGSWVSCPGSTWWGSARPVGAQEPEPDSAERMDSEFPVVMGAVMPGA